MRKRDFRYFGIYGKDVQEADDTTFPEDVKIKLLRFGRAAVAAAVMRGRSYLQIGSGCMEVAGSYINADDKSRRTFF